MSMRDLDRYRTTRPDLQVGSSRSRGFTLIELMIVVAVIAILAAIAYPSYEQHVRKTYRADAQADLMELASFMERFYTENNTYDLTVTTPNTTLPFSQTPHSGGARYNLTLATAAGPPPTFTLTATAQSLGGQNQDPCGNMTISNTGAKTHTGSAANCW
jgi:type IV pilus assembly protein PilE